MEPVQGKVRGPRHPKALECQALESACSDASLLATLECPMPASPAPSPAKTLPLAACGFSHSGRQREHNEDAFGSFVDARLFIVADGMGGHNSGEVASVMAIDALETFFRSYHADPRQPWPHAVDPELSLGANLLRVGIKVANDRIREAAKQDRAKSRMGTTIVAAAVGDAQL